MDSSIKRKGVCDVYHLLGTFHLRRYLYDAEKRFGINRTWHLAMGNGINFGIFAMSKPNLFQSAFIEGEAIQSMANDPLPQALVLTAIVIGFALCAFLICVPNLTKHL